MPAGIHWATWEELVVRFGITSYRRRLLTGMRAAIESLRLAGCPTVYVDGSFVTTKYAPNDFDCCWEINGVDAALLDPILLLFDPNTDAQKAKFYGELFPNITETNTGSTFLEFFQVDKENGKPKGIIALDLARMK